MVPFSCSVSSIATCWATRLSTCLAGTGTVTVRYFVTILWEATNSNLPMNVRNAPVTPNIICRSNMSIAEFRSLYPELWSHIIANLRTTVVPSTTSSTTPPTSRETMSFTVPPSTTPSVFLSLSLLSNLYPSPHTPHEEQEFSPYLIPLLHCKSTIRNVVARTIPLCCPVGTCTVEAVRILTELGHYNTHPNRHNIANGELSFIVEFIKSAQFSKDGAAVILPVLESVVGRELELLECNECVLLTICQTLHLKHPSDVTTEVLQHEVQRVFERGARTSGLVSLLVQCVLQLGTDYSLLYNVFTKQLCLLEEEVWGCVTHHFLTSSEGRGLAERLAQDVQGQGVAVDPQFKKHVLRFIFSVLKCDNMDIKTSSGFVNWVFAPSQRYDPNTLPLLVYLACKCGIERSEQSLKGDSESWIEGVDFETITAKEIINQVTTNTKASKVFNFLIISHR